MNIWVVSLVWLIAYGLIAGYLRRRGSVDGVSVNGPILMWRSRYGLDTINRLAQATGFWRFWGLLGLVVALGGLLLSEFLIITGLYGVLTQPEAASTIQNPKNVLVIPGVNDYLPLAATPEIVLGLLIGMVIHEGGHAIMCRIADIDIKSTGLFFLAGLPLGAFVEPDEESERTASRGGRLRMFAGGIMNNVAFTILALGLLFGPVTMFITTAPGAPVGGVLAESPAAEAGLGAGDRITAVNNQTITDAEDLEATLSNTSATTVTVTRGNGSTVTVKREVFVTAVATSAPDAFETGARITAINGEPIQTISDYRQALRAADDRARFTLASGDTVTVSPGVTAVAQPNQPLARAGAPTNTTFNITAVNGSAVYTQDGLLTAVDDYAGGETVTLTAVVNGTTRQYTVTLTPDGLVGAQVGGGTAGIAVDDFGARYYPADRYLSIIKAVGSDAGDLSLLERVLTVFILPLASINPSIVFDFPGFTPYVQQFYTVTGLPAWLAGAWFFLASTLYWSAWININLAVFNCLPTYALDGGHILRDTVDELVDRTPGLQVEGSVGTIVKQGVLGATLLALVGMVFGPMLLQFL